MEDKCGIKIIIVLLVVVLFTGFMGFGGIAGDATALAQIIFFLFAAVLFVYSLFYYFSKVRK